MGFFSKFTDVWKKIGFKESEEMRNYREQYEELNEQLIVKEKEILRNKDKMKRSRIMYQQACNHERISRRVRQSKPENIGSFNDFSAKCAICGAEIYDQARCINYLNSAIDMLYKMPKTIESAKMADMGQENDAIYNLTFNLISEFINLRDKISSVKSDDYNNCIFKNTVKEED